mmetsp:Transcript_30246/g.59189  ORF Transcript_30246/g.59189 Transcript_30246/m.59189 type:complete len:119 (-) Transcript_30246:163-519(-)
MKSCSLTSSEHLERCAAMFSKTSPPPQNFQGLLTQARSPSSCPFLGLKTAPPASGADPLPATIAAAAALSAVVCAVRAAVPAVSSLYVSLVCISYLLICARVPLLMLTQGLPWTSLCV